MHAHAVSCPDCSPKGLAMVYNFHTATQFLYMILQTVVDHNLSCRQQRKYRLFAGLWFGTSKPHFQTFMQPFANALNDLFHKGKVTLSFFLSI